MSTSCRTHSLRRSRASESLRSAFDHPSPSSASSRSSGRGGLAFRRNGHHALQSGECPTSLASGHDRSLSPEFGTPSDQSFSADGPSSPASDISVYANQGSTRADHGSPYAAHLSLPADLHEHDPLAGETRRWREGVFGRRVQSLGIGAVRGFAVRAARSLGARAVKDAVLALLRHTLTLARQRSLLSIDSSGARAFGAEGEPMFGGEPQDVYARECLAPVASTLSLSSELRDWVAWYRAGLLGSSSDLGEGADGFDGHSGAQDDYDGVLGESRGVLDDGTGGLDDDVLGAPGDHSDGSDDHTDALDDRAGSLDEHTAAVDDLSGALDDDDGAVDDDDSALEEYTDALEDHTGDLVNDAITRILRFNDEAIRKASVSLRIYSSFNRAGERPSSGASEDPKSSAGQRPLSWVGENSSGQKGEVSSSGVGESTSGSAASGPAKETGSLPDPSWGVWRREAWYVAEDEGPSNGRRDTSTWAEDPSSSTKRKLGPSTSEYEPGASTSTRELGNSMAKNENLTPSPDSLNGGTPASHAPPSPVFDSPETFSTRWTTPSLTKVALPHASPTVCRPSPTVRRPSPCRPSSLVPPPVSTRPQRSSPLGTATSHQGNATSHQGSDGQSATAEESICRRWSSPPYLGSSTSTPPHPGPPPSISVRHSSLSRANIRNVLDALPALSRGRSVPPRATISNATAPNATTLNATNPNAPTSNRATSSGAEAYIYPSAHATTPSYPVLSSSRPTSTSKPADAVVLKPADAERSQARDFEILLSPPSSLRALPSLALGDVPPADQLTFQLSQVPLGVQTTLRDAEHLAQAAKERWSSSTSPDDALWRAALDDIARAIHDTRRMLHKYKTTEIKLDKDPKCTDARCYTEGLKGMMGTCAAFVHRMDRDPRACGCDWLCDVRDHVVAHEARIRSAIHALANHDIQARLADLEELALPMSQER